MASNRIDLSTAVWRKSNHSNGDGVNCVEVADDRAGIVPSPRLQAPHGPILTLTALAWTSFVTPLKDDPTEHAS